MTWILIVGFVGAYRGGVASAQFETQQACETAKAVISEEYAKANATMFSDGRGGIFAVCTPSR